MTKLNQLFRLTGYSIRIYLSVLQPLFILAAGVLILTFNQSHASTPSSSVEVTVMDHGLDMAIATYTLPPGWKIDQDIVTDALTGKSTRYKLDILGPHGEIIRHLLPVLYGDALGDFTHVWQKTARHALLDITSDVTFGQPETDGDLIRKRRTIPSFEQDAAQAGVENIYEVNVTGTRKDKPYAGKLLLYHSPPKGGLGVILPEILLGPADLLTQTIEIYLKMTASLKENVQYGQTLSAIAECQHMWRAGSGIIDLIKIDGKTVRNDPRELNPDLYQRCLVIQSNLYKATRDGSDYDDIEDYIPDEDITKPDYVDIDSSPSR